MSSNTSPGAWSYSMTAYSSDVAARSDSASGTSPSPARRWSRLADPNFGAPGANGLLAGGTPSLMCCAMSRSPRRATSAGTSCPPVSAQKRSSSIATRSSVSAMNHSYAVCPSKAAMNSCAWLW